MDAGDESFEVRLPTREERIANLRKDADRTATGGERNYRPLRLEIRAAAMEIADALRDLARSVDRA